MSVPQMSKSFAEEAQDMLDADPALEAAADEMWSSNPDNAQYGKSWRDMDSLGQLEFLNNVGRIVDAYINAQAVTQSSDPAPKP